MKLSGLLAAGLVALLAQPVDTSILNFVTGQSSPSAPDADSCTCTPAQPARSKLHKAVDDIVQTRIPINKVVFHPARIDSSQHLDMSNPLDRVAILISMNEGKPTTIDWNDNGHGISVGLFQANQKVGELPDLLQSLCAEPEGRRQLNNAFGKALAAKIEKDPEIVRNLNFRRNNWLGRGLAFLVHKPVFKESEIAMIRQKVKQAAEVAQEHGIKTMQGVALCADLTNQWGPAGAQRFIHAAADQHSQRTKVLAIVKAVARQSIYGVRYFQDLQRAEALDLTSVPFVSGS